MYLAPKLFRMFYYNITYQIEKPIFEAWKTWMFQTHIPQLLSEGKFNQAKVIKVNIDAQDTETYSIQLETSENKIIKEFQEKKEARFRHLMYLQFGEQVLSFATELHIIQTFSQ